MRILVLILVLSMVCPSVAAEVLTGGVKNSRLVGGAMDEYGRVGVKIDRIFHRITKVYRRSPAAAAGLKREDIVVRADDVDGHKFVDGIAGTAAHLVIRRGPEVFEVDIIRVPPREIR